MPEGWIDSLAECFGDRMGAWECDVAKACHHGSEDIFYRFLEQMKPAFEQVKGFRPKASRSVSREMFVIAAGFRPGVLPSPASPTPARKRPSTGWS